MKQPSVPSAPFKFARLPLPSIIQVLAKPPGAQATGAAWAGETIPKERPQVAKTATGIENCFMGLVKSQKDRHILH